MFRLLTLLCLSSVFAGLAYNVFGRGRRSAQYGQASRQRRDVNLSLTENVTEILEASTPPLKLIDVRRCCDVGDELNERHECESATADDDNLTTAFFETHQYLDRLSTNLSRVNLLDYDGVCKSAFKSVINWYEDKPNYYFISADNGSLIELSDDRLSISHVYPTDKFCIGPYKERIVGILCPGDDEIYIPKCCDKGYYYDTINQTCLQMNQNIIALQPVFYQVLHEVGTNESFVLAQSRPQCNQSDRMIEDGNPFYLQDDGMLMVDYTSKGQFHFYKNTQYCVDVFSDGNVSQTNVFFCDGESNIIFSYEYNKTRLVKLIRSEDGEGEKNGKPSRKADFQRKSEEDGFRRGRKEFNQLQRDIEEYEDSEDARSGDVARTRNLITCHLYVVLLTVALM